MNAATTTTPTPRTAESTMPDLITYDLYIDGRSTKPASGLYFSSDNPYTGEIWASIARGYSGGNSLLGHPRFLA